MNRQLMTALKSLLVGLCLLFGLAGLTHIALEANRSITPIVSALSAHWPRNLRISGTKLDSADQGFLQEAYAHGLFEMAAGQLALRNSGILEVRILAAHILRSRARMDEQLKALAKAKGLDTLWDELDAKQEQKLELLQEVSADDFDLTYCSTVVSSHLRDIKALQSEIEQGSDA